MKSNSLGLAVLLLITVQVNGQSIESILTNFAQYQQQTPIEKAYIRTDKEVYFQNETLWFSVYLVDGVKFLPNSPSSLLYVNLFGPDNELLSSLPIKIEEGNGAGDFYLSDSLVEGTYTLMAYTKYMRNFDPDYFFSKPINLLHYRQDSSKEISSSSFSDIDLQLFPEGGYLINGLTNMVAFRATNKKGYGVNLQYQIVNGKGEEISRFNSQHLGMGVFQFTPEDGESYFAKYTLNGKDKSIPLPERKDSGYQLAVRQDVSKTYITVKATPDLDFNDCFILAHIRGKVVAVVKAKPGDSYIYYPLNNSQVPSGIMHITVFKSGYPILERLAFIDNPLMRPKLTTELKNESLQNRDRANFEIFLNSDSIPLSGNISVSVLKASENANIVDIENYLLLTSDLKGTIEKPGYYFDQSNLNRLKHLDLLMLTHGWRRFDWSEVLSGSLPNINFYPEKGFTIEGRVVDYYKRNKSKSSKILLTSLSDFSLRLEAETDKDGIFWFDGLQINDTVNLLVRAITDNPTKREKKKANKRGENEDIRNTNSFIKLKKNSSPTLNAKHLNQLEIKDMYHQQFADKQLIELIKKEFDSTTIMLEGVEVTTKRDRRSEPYFRDATVMPYAQPDSRVIIDSLHGQFSYYFDIFNLVIRIFPNIRVDRDENGLKRFVVRDNSNPSLLSMPDPDVVLVVYLDGRKLINNGELYTINPQTIEFIDYMRGITIIHSEPYPPPRALFLYSRTSYDVPDPNGFQMIKMFGYNQPNEFYVPKYDMMSERSKLKPDFRSTQYWNPNVKISNGKGSFNFYTSDDKGDFIIYFEGISTDGRILKNQFKYSVD